MIKAVVGTIRACPVLIFLAVVAPVAPAGAEPAPKVSAARDIRVLAPAGMAAGWRLGNLVLDTDGSTSYTIFRRGEDKSSPQGVMTKATREKPTIPKVRDAADGLSQGQEAVRPDKEVFIPALKRKVRYYLLFHGGGADNDTYCTEPIERSDGHGGTLWIVVQAEHGMNGGPSPARLLASVEWLEPGVIAKWEKEYRKQFN